MGLGTKPPRINPIPLSIQIETNKPADAAASHGVECLRVGMSSINKDNNPRMKEILRKGTRLLFPSSPKKRYLDIQVSLKSSIEMIWLNYNE